MKDPLKLNAQISEEAVAWFVEFREGDVDARDRQRFDAWVRLSPEHLRAYLEVAAIWSHSAGIDPQRQIDLDALRERARAEDNVVELGMAEAVRATGRMRSWRQRLTRRPAALAAACVLLLLMGGMLAVGVDFLRAPLYSTEVGEQRSFSLADGSVVSLNSRSRLRVRFTRNERRIELLEGQALFSVAKDPKRPFVVRSGEVRVRAVGTQFDVYRKTRGTTVTVVEGHVAVSNVSELPASKSAPAASPAKPSPARNAAIPEALIPRREDAAAVDRNVYLSAGEQLTVMAAETAVAAQADVAAATAWTQRKIILESASLESVAEEFNRYSPRRLRIIGPTPANLKFSGVFSSDPAFLIRFLKERSDLRIRETDSEIIITYVGVSASGATAATLFD